MAKITRLPKFVDNILFPDKTAKHWKLFNKYNNTKSRIRKLFLLAKIKKIQRNFNCSIPVSRKINPFKTPHGLSGIFISAAATVAPGCIIFQNVTIGSNTIKGHKREGAPQIAEGVMIGANAVVIGGVTVGKNAKIGAGCAVTKDVPAGATAVSSSIRIIEGDPDAQNVFRAITDTDKL